jgi:heptosyltransferase-3
LQPVRRVIIYRLGSLGDTVAALPCFHLVEQAFPNAERLVLTNVPVSSKAAPLEIILKDGGFIHGSIPYPIGLRDPRALLRLMRELRHQDADTLVYMAASRGLASARRDVTYFRLCGFRRIIGAPLTSDLQMNRIDADGELERESHRLGRTLAELGSINFDDRSWWDLRLTQAEQNAGAVALGSLATQPFIVVNTGGKAVEKDWGETNWTTFLRVLADRVPGYGLVFVGAQDDSERAQRLSVAWSAGSAVDLCGRLAPRESAVAISRASLFIGHDSGPMHLADAVGTPCIGLLGSYNRPKMWHPSGISTNVIHRMDGLATILPEEVLEGSMQVLDRAAAESTI